MRMKHTVPHTTKVSDEILNDELAASTRPIFSGTDNPRSLPQLSTRNDVYHVQHKRDIAYHWGNAQPFETCWK